MKRAAFIKNLLTLGAFAYLPKGIAKQYTRYYLLQSFVAGFQYYEGLSLLAEMKEGSLLELVREPENTFDSCAIALHYNGKKIGFIPQRKNRVLSKLIDAQALDLLAEITHLNAQTEAWENVRVAIYFLKEDAEVLPQAEYLTVLHTPNYQTIKLRNDHVQKVFVGESETVNTNWYAVLEDNSTNDGIYDIIHSSNVQPDYEYGKETGEYFIVNKQRIPLDEQILDIMNKAEAEMGELNELFHEEGFVVVTAEETEALVPKLSAIADVPDKLGRHFIELRF
jgi:hypothetical protein